MATPDRSGNTDGEALLSASDKENRGRNQPDGTPGGLADLCWEDLPPLLEELRQIAVRLLTRWSGMDSLQPTLLVNTALRRQRRSDQSWDDVTWASRAQLFGQARRAMVQKLGEYRRHQRTKRYRAQRRVSVKELELFESWRQWIEDPDMALALEVAVRELEENHPELFEVVHYRIFASLSESEIAQMLECDSRTIRRKYAKARVLMEESIRRSWDREHEA